MYFCCTYCIFCGIQNTCSNVTFVSVLTHPCKFEFCHNFGHWFQRKMFFEILALNFVCRPLSIFDISDLWFSMEGEIILNRLLKSSALCLVCNCVFLEYALVLSIDVRFVLFLWYLVLKCFWQIVRDITKFTLWHCQARLHCDQISGRLSVYALTKVS